MSVMFAACLAAAFCLAIGSLDAAATDGDEKEAAEPNWQRLDKALALAKDSGKHIIINFYTDWCPNCRRMNERTYRDDEVLKQLQQAFIPVKLNAESSSPLIIEGQTISEAQVAMMFRVNSYPTTWFLSPEGRPPHTRARVLRTQALRSNVAIRRRRMVRENGLRHVHGAREGSVENKSEKSSQAESTVVGAILSKPLIS